MKKNPSEGIKIPELNKEQKTAVESSLGPLLIVAGAGTGKTRTLMSRLLYLLAQGVPPRDICAITFTNKAAHEMEERMTQSGWLQKTYKGHRDPFIGTFHSLGARMLRTEAKFLGRTANFVIFDDGDSLSLVKKIFKSMGIKKSDLGPAQALQKISRAKSNSIPYEEIESSHAPADMLLIKIWNAYEEKLKEQNAFDFDDLIQKIVWLCGRNNTVREKYERMFPHLLIDEYQDLNNIQYELVKILGARAASLSAVGDDAQMIYGWRGSNIEIFLNFEKDWKRTNTVFLEENYRSSGHIVRAASSVIKHNARASGWRTKALRTKNSEGLPIRIIETEGNDEEAVWLAEDISGARNGSAREEIAVLYRTNAQSRPIEQALLEREIPYRVFGGLKFYERREVKDVVAGLRYALNEKDEISRERLEKNLLKSRFFAFDEALRNLREGPRGQAISPADYIGMFLKSTDYLQYLEKNFMNAAERGENVAALVQFAFQFETLPPLLERIALLQAHDDIQEKNAAAPVTLTTIHLAKGLEFDRVYLAGACEGILPHARSLATNDELEEERRLMYVAMTRARHNLAISFYDIPSRFVSELPEEHCVFENRTFGGIKTLGDEERYISLD